jgi:formamidopyrimidine-DNA glycosylase
MGIVPELPDITVYGERILAMAKDQSLVKLRIARPFVLRTVHPGPELLAGQALRDVKRIGKRIVLAFDNDLYAVIHLMIAGRLHWREPGSAIPRGNGMFSFDFPAGSLMMTEASTKRRASLHLVAGAAGLLQFERGGIDMMAASSADIAVALRRHNRTLKRALTDPSIVDGIGNAYSDEILHRARLSPFALTGNLTDDAIVRLIEATRAVVREWIDRLRDQAGDGFLAKVTAFRPEMAVHGKYGEPCPVCGVPVQRIVYAENEANYCPGCQTGGRVLADRSLSRLLKDDWPRTVDELEKLHPSPEGGR